MRLLAVGGGSGGHVTPVLAVINELKRLDSTLEAEFICDKAFEAQAKGLMAGAKISVPVKIILAGKLRRYHGVSFWSQLLDVRTNLHNLKDLFLVIGGFFQSLVILSKYKPDVVFAKGGYVCLPVGAAAKLLNIPLVIHDSDTHPGLTNRVLSRWATRIGTGAPLENYPYPAAISRYVGVPIDASFRPFTLEQQTKAKAELGMVDLNKPLLAVVGGGLGANNINQALLESAEQLLGLNISIYHISGKSHYDELVTQKPNHADYHLVPFIYKNMATVLGAADIIITRGSATFLQELAALGKTVIVVPASQLRDQNKNASVFEAANAAVVLSDEDVRQPGRLSTVVGELINNPEKAKGLAANLYKFARPEAALDVARLIVSATRQKMEKG